MGKLGKKARKFARKKLQSVQRMKRKKNSFFKRKAPSHKNLGATEDSELLEKPTVGQLSGIANDEVILNNFLDTSSDEGTDELVEDSSDSDGFLSEDSECPYISDKEDENIFGDKCDHSALVEQNKQLAAEIEQHKKKLERLLKKDPKFSEYLVKQKALLEKSRREENSSDEEEGLHSPVEDTIEGKNEEKPLSSSTVDVWCWMVLEQPKGPALRNLLNGFHAACQYGIETSGVSSQKVSSREAFSKIVTFVLLEADGIFCQFLGLSGPTNKEGSLNFRNKSEWESLRPLVKCYLRSSLILINQVTDREILIFALTRLRSSLKFFSDFPSLSGRLTKISVHLWISGDEKISLASFMILRDISSNLSSDWVDVCLKNMYKAFLRHCKSVEPDNLKHIKFLVDSIVQVYSLEIQRSYPNVQSSVQQLANVLKQAIKMKKKEDLKKISCWQYILCTNLWVEFISCNARNHDLQQVLFMLINIIRGISHLFPGPRYVPLRLKCVQMLNRLSLSCGVFIPVACMVFDCLEQKTSGSTGTRTKSVKLSSLLKVPKHLLKSEAFQEECVLSVIEILSAHFSQWKHHVSFPDLATIPLILLKKFHVKAPSESLRRPVKRLIDQVERNIEFVAKKRDEVSFSPNDQASVEAFLQLESGANTPFAQYYVSISKNSHSRTMIGG
ncbi:nucleolar complex protein 2 homolog [Dioscorea cayenensis subsp. rotundata]|uniref:Nucleolar complex protein 2 homolog n=1 Tax=Dioscorea cayennensis subsp. rotundata TaxID=55577 RepID=A0AB40CMA3_DIOCR|nr:nucleolar complex protein 2 homolog [Dioscorea cayenensis subsp. rotundata]XP_039140203.1 nucleolar complex protein 2 homolog [Dioscorea cayenensis subsp. rotundata]